MKKEKGDCLNNISVIGTFLWCFLSFIIGILILVMLDIFVGINVQYDWLLSLTILLPFFTLVWRLKRKQILIEPICGDVRSFPNRRNWLKILSTEMLITVFSLAFIMALLFIFSNLFPDYMIDFINSISEVEQKGSILLHIITLSIIVPITEEFIFRGFLFRKWCEKYGLLAGAMLSSIIFSVLHLNYGIAGHFLFGIFMCFLYVSFNNLWVPIAVHALHNFVLSTTSYMLERSSDGGEINIEETLNEIALFGTVGGVIAIITLPIVIFILRKYYLAIRV
ncbi:CPBP family intramembrane glutamic endopeptidase [Halalkalibacter urbisdiaboli]|uniref:CPBP family intramembrane glutamic endopeptidase n=1 Tax=Halalkalibacter urbisdiaboli TaxID=1960589 RepID=UPI0013FDA85D|nr:type II CAAX endopeptidase family protein [Halalkalibacter urbisdiaboli]